MKSVISSQKATTSNKEATLSNSARNTTNAVTSILYACNSDSANVQLSSYTWAKKNGRQFKLAAISTMLCYNLSIPNKKRGKVYQMNTVTANHKVTTSNKAATLFSTIDNSVLLDTEINPTAFRLYCIIVMLAGNDNQVCVRIKKLANLLDRSPRSVRRELNVLIDKGIIEKIRRKNTDETEEYLESIFIVHDCIRDRQEA